MRTAEWILTALFLTTSVTSGDDNLPGAIYVTDSPRMYGAVLGVSAGAAQVSMFYFVRYHAQWGYPPFTTIDSIEALACTPCDTNAIACAVVGRDSLYLLGVRLSPFTSIDTLARCSNHPPESWLQDFQNVAVSLPDSIIVSTFSFGYWDERLQRRVGDAATMEIRRLGADGKLHLIRQVQNALNTCSAADFKGFTFAIRQSPTDILRAASYCVRYTSSSQKLDTIRASEGSILEAKCRSISGALYYTRQTDKDRNLWKVDVDGEHSQLTFEIYPMGVRTFNIRADVIEVEVDDVVHAWTSPKHQNGHAYYLIE